MRLLITGSRDFNDGPLFDTTLMDFWINEGIDLIIHGAARGADTYAKVWATIHGIPDLPFPVTNEDWIRLGKKAGPIRNQQMLDEGKPDYCLAFPLKHSTGTWDMIRRCSASNIPTRIIQ